MDDYGLSRQVMADMEKVYDDLIIINLLGRLWILLHQVLYVNLPLQKTCEAWKKRIMNDVSIAAILPTYKTASADKTLPLS